MTPLHLAIKSVNDLNTTRPVKALLIRGANRFTRNKKGEGPVEIARLNVSNPSLLA